jgi:hypothetical protein
MKANRTMIPRISSIFLMPYERDDDPTVQRKHTYVAIIKRIKRRYWGVENVKKELISIYHICIKSYNMDYYDYQITIYDYESKKTFLCDYCYRYGPVQLPTDAFPDTSLDAHHIFQFFSAYRIIFYTKLSCTKLVGLLRVVSTACILVHAVRLGSLVWCKFGNRSLRHRTPSLWHGWNNSIRLVEINEGLRFSFLNSYVCRSKFQARPYTSPVGLRRITRSMPIIARGYGWDRGTFVS